MALMRKSAILLQNANHTAGNSKYQSIHPLQFIFLLMKSIVCITLADSLFYNRKNLQYAPNAKKIHHILTSKIMVLFKNDGFGKIEICAIPDNYSLLVYPETQKLLIAHSVSIGCGNWCKISQEHFDIICEKELM